VSFPNENLFALTVPALVQVLSRRDANRLRADFAAQGFAELRPAHAVVLAPLFGGGRRAADIADLLGVTRQAVAQVVQDLEAGGYVRRLADPGDARAKLICLTARGRAALRAMRASRLAVEREWAERLGPQRLEDLRTALTQLIQTPGDYPPDHGPADHGLAE
jgi:DNA-binding MarR family transcriptional regulator